MKIILLGDLHFGIKSDSVIFQQYQSKLLKYMFDIMEENQINMIIQMGDVTDRRKYINYNSATVLSKSFLQPILDNNYKCHIIVGNHDCYYKNTNEVNSLKVLLNYPSNIEIYDSLPSQISIDGVDMLLVPWITSENKDESFSIIKNNKSPICLGHLELYGFEMESGELCSYGYDPSIFKNFKHVFSGHFHQPSSKDNIKYLGAPFQLTWADYGKARGFWIFDTESYQLQFYENPFKIFEKVIYNDEETTIDDLLEHDFKQYKDKIIKLIVKQKSNIYWFDQFIDGIENSGAHSVTIVEDFINLSGISNDVNIQDIDDTKDIIKKYIDEMQLAKSLKTKVNNLLSSLHTEAMNQVSI